jgi:hypothetical protein
MLLRPGVARHPMSVCIPIACSALIYKVLRLGGCIVRYYFNIAGAVVEPDKTGVEFATMSDARIAAVKSAAEYLRDRPELVWLGEEFRVEVTDEDHRLLFTFVAVGVDAPAGEGRIRL